MDLKIIRLPLGSYQTNCYIIFDKNNNAVIIDPGSEASVILDELKERNLKAEYILLTHAHPDHFGAVNEINKELNVDIYISEDDKLLLETRSKDLSRTLGIDTEEVIANKYLRNNDSIKFGDHAFKVISTPGHTEGSICLLLDNILFSGDTLFFRSIGRTDLLGGNYEDIIASLNKLMDLDDDIIVLPGHGQETTIGFEKQNNPFINR